MAGAWPEPPFEGAASNVNRMRRDKRGASKGSAAPTGTRSTVIDPPGTEAVSIHEPPPVDGAWPAPRRHRCADARRLGAGPLVVGPGPITVITIASVIVVTLSQLHPSLLLTNTTTTGGDTGAHIAMPKYLESLLTHGHLTGWDPGWYDGFPLYTFYFTLPDLFIAVAG